MISPTLRLSTDELLSALDVINPVDLLVDELVAGRPSDPGGRLIPWRGDPSAGPAGGLILLEDLRAGSSCVLPTSVLCAFRTAALAALAARALVTPGVVTAAVLGSGFAAQPPLAVIARHVPGISHLAVCPASPASPAGPDRLARTDGWRQPVRPMVLDQLDLSGIGLSITSAVSDAVFGATLVVAAAAGLHRFRLGQLTRGAVVINAAGEDLPDELVDGVDQLYVDDAALLERNVHRSFVRRHLAGMAVGSRRPVTIEADLGQVLTGAHAGRTHIDDILLVELLGGNAMDVRLACSLHRAALANGLGVQLIE